MKFAFVVMAVILFATVARASLLDCESVRDPDQRNMCRAKASGNPGWCTFIKDHDWRARCKAEVPPRR